MCLASGRWRSSGHLVALSAVVWGVVACGSQEHPIPDACPRTEAAFRLEVTAETPRLPPRVSIAVRYQGSNEESFDPSVPPVDNEDVCCKASTTRLGDLPSVACPGSITTEAGAPAAIYCELWTGGVTEVTVHGTGYPDIVETLQAVAREDGCGLETTSVHLELAHPDGGS
jgi:hypothetical protein